MKELQDLENSLRNSKDINFLRLVRKKNSAKSKFPHINDNLLNLIYHSVLRQPIDRRLGYEDTINMTKILSNTTLKSIRNIHTISVEYDKHMELSELRGVYCEYKIPVGLRETRRILIPEAKEYLKGFHSVWREKKFQDELKFTVRVNLFANEKFFNKSLRGR